MLSVISGRPVPDVSDAGGGRWFYDFLTMVYEGTYGIFSVALVITIAYSYAMEKMNRWKMSLCMWLWHLPHSAHS